MCAVFDDAPCTYDKTCTESNCRFLGTQPLPSVFPLALPYNCCICSLSTAANNRESGRETKATCLNFSGVFLLLLLINFLLVTAWGFFEKKSDMNIIYMWPQEWWKVSIYYYYNQTSSKVISCAPQLQFYSRNTNTTACIRIVRILSAKVCTLSWIFLIQLRAEHASLNPGIHNAA